MACGGVFAIAQGNEYTLEVDAFYDKGIIRDGDNKRITGIVRFVRDDGYPVVWQVKNGLITFGWAYYPSGSLYVEIPFKNGVLEGTEKFYYEDGSLYMEAHYKNGVPEGTEKTYYENGRLWWTHPYVNGKRQGVSTCYAENGRIIMKITYKNYRAVSGACANGRALTFAELTNLMNGLNVECY
ncbi:hypothetical protein AGMMS49941_04720 [Deferribacterales bacterium]|nr:hypothetical protein AGMMS49941_04720 [Deferribacterales bacterium]